MKRYADCLYLAFDCDGAGTKAVFRAAELALPHGFSLKVVRFPGGKDPDELLRHSGAEAVANAVGDARDFFEFALDYLNAQNGNEPAGRAATAEAMLGFIMNLESDAAKSAYVSWLAEEGFTDISVSKDGPIDGGGRVYFKAKRGTEIEIFAGEIIKLGQKHNIPTPLNREIYNKIKQRPR